MRQRLGGLFVAGVSAAALVGAFAIPAEAGNLSTLTVNKVVIGPVPPGTTFVVELNCDETGNPDIDSITFDAEGNPVGPNEIDFSDPVTCTPTETQTGGAQTVAYECEDTSEEENACTDNGPSADPITVNMDFEPFDEDPVVTVTNTFGEPPPPPPPPEPAAVTPTFTG